MSLRYLAIVGLTAFLSTNVDAGILEDIRAAGSLKCGVGDNRPGFAYEGPDGRWAGLDVDTCRAVAAAVFGNTDTVVFSGLSVKEGLTSLQAGDVDMLAQSLTWTVSRDTAYELDFAGVNYYDGQAFLVRKDLGLGTAKELDSALVCVTVGTTSERNLNDFFRLNEMELRTAPFEYSVDAAAAYEQGECDALANDRSALAGFRTGFKNPEEHVILPDIISKEPLGPVVRHGDDRWSDIVKWTIFALIQAEESGVTSQNVDDMKASQDPTIQRLLGVSGEMGRQMGLPNDWAYQIVKKVGNYGEIYERNVGPNTPLGLERGLNGLWTDGGLMYAMPFR